MIEKKLLLKILNRIAEGLNEDLDEVGGYVENGYRRCIEDIEHFLNDEEDTIYDEEDTKDIL